MASTEASHRKIAMSAKGGRGRRGSRACALPLCAALGLLVTGCASSGPEFGDNHRARYHRGQPSYKVGAAYQINGVWYHPRVDYNYNETGLASWYGEARPVSLYQEARPEEHTSELQ